MLTFLKRVSIIIKVDSVMHDKKTTFRSSSVVEQPAVNRLVVGSSPTFGAMARWSSG